MSDETKKTGQSDGTKNTDETQTDQQDGGKTAGPKYTQEDLDRIIAMRLNRYGDPKEIKEELEALQAEKKQREQQKLEEQGKFEELKTQLEEELNQLKPYKEKWESWQAAETERIQAAMDGLSDSQKGIIESLPLEKRMNAINEFKQQSAATSKPGLTTQKGGKLEGVPSIEEIYEMRNQSNPAWKKHYQKYLDQQKGL